VVLVLTPLGSPLAAHPVMPPVLEVGTNFYFWGMEHLVGGFDHLAFLASLLLPGGRLGRLAKVTLGFTLSHILTLGRVANGLFYVERWWLEPLIAASIVFVALDAAKIQDKLRPRADHRFEWALGFGLVHGMGFASALDELGVAPGTLLTALLGFNLGLETVQILVILTALPLLFWLAKQTERKRNLLVRWSGYGIAACGTWWCLERFYHYNWLV